MLREANIVARVEAELSQRQGVLRESLTTLRAVVCEELEESPEQHWTQPVRNVADAIASRIEPDPGLALAS